MRESIIVEQNLEFEKSLRTDSEKVRFLYLHDLALTLITKVKLNAQEREKEEVRCGKIGPYS